ncbi:MAG: DUF4139 domain-containing protein [Gammaproteobacteria bacterium]|nr:DUF4139 domain-containing protein [Gammaproteobacteria bacterium]
MVRILKIVIFSYFSLSLAEDLRIVVSDEQQVDVSVTVYDGNFAIIREKRNVLLPLGEFELEFQDVARSIDPSSVSVTSDSDEKGLQVLEQSYRYDLLNKQTLLERFLGQKLKYSRSVQDGIRFERLLREGILLSINPEVVRFGDEIEIDPEGIITLAYLPDDLKTTPTLLWNVENTIRGRQGLQISYLTENISWRTDYVLTLSADESQASLDGWVTLVNQSGAVYKNAMLKLVAGDVRRVRDLPQLARRATQQALGLSAEAAIVPSQESFFEYHLYDFPRRTTLETNSVKQVRLMTARGIDVEKSYVLQNEVVQYQAQGTQKLKANVILTFRNTRRNNLNVPLPAGKVRVYKADSGGVLLLAGEDRVQHTPVNSDIEIKVGRAFDVTAIRKQTNYRRLGNRGAEVSYSITVKNHKNKAIELMVKEKLNGAWVITQESHKGEKLDSATMAYRLKMRRGAEQTITYTAQFNY